MHETLQPGQVHDLYHEAYMALLTFQIEDLTEKIGAITTAGGTQWSCTHFNVTNPIVNSHARGAYEAIAWQTLAVMLESIRLLSLLYQMMLSRNFRHTVSGATKDRSDAGAAEEDDSQEAITSSSREQIESFIGAVAEKIAPPAAEARPNSVGHFPPRQASHPAMQFPALVNTQGHALLLC